jgi:FkbM family methyltransferase
MVKRTTTERIGTTMTDFTNPSDIRASLEYLKRHGVVPTAAADVGGCTGEWSRVFLDTFPGTPVLLIEPQDRYTEQLSRLVVEHPSMEYVQALVGEKKNIEGVTFYVHDDRFGGGSSLYQERTNVPYHKITSGMTTLDAICHGCRTPRPDFLKLDTQGAELDVLNGAPTVVHGAKYIMIEVSVWQYNKGAPLIGEVFAWMTSHGFVLFDLCEVHRIGDGLLNQLDLLFVRRELEELRGKGPINFGGWPPAPEDL